MSASEVSESNDIPTTVVGLKVSCTELPQAMFPPETGPICVLYIQDFGSKNWKEYARTEKVEDQHMTDPDFCTHFLLDYYFELRQFLRLDIYAVANELEELQMSRYIGSVEVTLGETIAQRRIERNLAQPKKTGTFGRMAVVGEELPACKYSVTLRFQARGLPRKWLLLRRDPFLAFYRQNADGTITLVDTTEVVIKTLRPAWNPKTIPATSLCGGDCERPIIVRVYDSCRNGHDEIIGEFKTTLRKLRNGPGRKNVYKIVDWQRKKKSRSYKHSGLCRLTYHLEEPSHTFLDYISAGTQLNCAFAIDFTASNGDPKTPRSLHYTLPMHPSYYSRVLRAVGEIIQDYDSDKIFPVFGFGARSPVDGSTLHEFNVNGSDADPNCVGLEGVMEAYENCLSTVMMFGPTHFAPIINHVAEMAAESTDGSQYYILLILTDGVINDMWRTKEAIVNASCLPLSIIIVGIGTADFTLMKELDGDEVTLTSRGRPAERDIVQFVAFNDFVRPSATPDDLHVSQAQLAKAVIAEIPQQFLSFMTKNNINPGDWKVSKKSLTAA